MVLFTPHLAGSLGFKYKVNPYTSQLAEFLSTYLYLVMMINGGREAAGVLPKI